MKNIEGYLKNEDVWLKAARFQLSELAKNVVVKVVIKIPHSVKI